ncbi:MAG: putative DNA-binding protein [Bacilli bacterium]|nr:putative DNA-binding protein [Bacilli bacterium]
MLQKTTRINMLYDFYHPLLTKKQMEYMELYYREDYSLSEIAEHHNVSRQAVHDTLKRTEQLLEMYEKKLRLYEKFVIRSDYLKRLEQLLQKESVDQKEALKIVEKLQMID